MGYALKRGWYDAFSSPAQQFQQGPGNYSTSMKPPPDVTRCVIEVTELPGGCSDNDVRNYFARYGQIYSVRLLNNGQAAHVQFIDASSAAHVVQLSKTTNMMYGPKRLRVEYASSQGTVDKSSSGESFPSHILHIDVASADYPITVDVIRSICQPHGTLVRVFIGKLSFHRSLEVLVEFENVDQAKKAKEHLDGADIYPGCCSLTVTYSKLTKVHVTNNGPESWDFTGPRGNMPGPLGTNPNQRTLLDVNSALPVPGAPNYPYPPAMPASYAPPRGYPGPHAPYYMPPYGAPPYTMQPGYGYPPQHPPYNDSFPPSAPVVPSVRSTIQNINTTKPKQLKLLPTPAPVHQVTPGGIGIGHATSNLNAPSLVNRQADLSVFESVEGVVLMVSNLPPSLNCDHLFNLLCLYGNIARIKFLKSRPGCALVQVGNVEAADFIHRYYNGVTLFGHTIQIHHSKQSELVEHDNLGTLDDGSPVMKNYMTDPNNRFRNSVVAAKSRILEPARTLHFFNTPLDFSPEDICKVIADCGAASPPRVVLFATKPGQKTSLGLVEWDTLAEALEALVLANQRPIHVSDIIHPFHLKLAYSPKPISPDRVGLSLIRYPAPPFAATRPGDNTSQSAPTVDMEALEREEAEQAKKPKTDDSGANGGNMNQSVKSLGDHNGGVTDTGRDNQVSSVETTAATGLNGT